MAPDAVTVLLTGFEAFGADTTNPTQLAVERLAQLPGAVPGVHLVTGVLPVVFGDALDVLDALVAQHSPDVVVAAGMASGRTAVTPERFAVNLDEPREGPGDDGRSVGGAGPQVPGGPVAHASTLPVDALVAGLRAAGIPATPSSSAGHYVCNHVFYGLMHRLAALDRPVTGGFVHVPCSHEQVLTEPDPRPSLSLETITEALRLAVALSAAPPAGPPRLPGRT